MAAYEKADFLAAYSFGVTDPNTGIKLAGGRHPSYAGLVDYNPNNGITCRFHHHPYILRQLAANRAQRLIDAGLVDDSSVIVVIGGAWGYLVSELKKLLPNLGGCSVDLSQYVQDTKDSPPDDDLIEWIIASGYDHTLPNSVGEYLFNTFTDPAPRADVIVLQESLSNTGSRNRVRNAIVAEVGRDVTRIITEDVWQIMSETEKGYVNQASTAWNIPVTHIIEGVIS